MAPENSEEGTSSRPWWPLAVGGLLAVSGFIVGQRTAAVDSIPHDVAAEDISAEQMEAALDHVIRVPLAFERSREMIRLLERRDLGPMITHRFAFDDFLEAFEVASSPTSGAKVMVEFDGAEA